MKEGNVQVEAYYDDDTPAAKALVRVLDGTQQEIAKGETDAKGRWSFPAPAPGKYEVVVDAGAGHRVSSKMTIADSTPSSSSKDRVSVGPGRTEFTQFPWLKVVLGLGLIGTVAAAFVIARANGKTKGDGYNKP